MRDRPVLQSSAEETLAGCSQSRRHTVFVGGFPCQDISPASKTRSGANGSRSGLWRDFLEVIAAFKPGWVVIENHANLRSKGLEQILSQLTAVGYDSEWHCISAGSIGAEHTRERLWIISYSDEVDGETRLRFRQAIEQQIRGAREKNVRTVWLETDRPSPGMADGLPAGLDENKRIAAVGNAIVPQIAEIIATAIKECMK